MSLDMVEEILKRVPVKTLGRWKCVSKQWKSTIESKSFQEKHLVHRQQSRDVPDLLFIYDVDANYNNYRRRRSSSSSSSSIIPIMFPIKKAFVSTTSCDGLVCLYKRRYMYQPSIVINPTTRWQRTLPPSKLQQLRTGASQHNLPSLGFGKDKFNGTYKLVWLYNNSREFKLPRPTTTSCEVFDFSTNAWKYVTPSSPYEIIWSFSPAYVDGSLHWFTKGKQPKVLSFDLHTETFQVIANAPFDQAHGHEYGSSIILRNLNNRLCVSKTKWSNQMIIWSFDSENKTWSEIFSIDSHSSHVKMFRPIAVLEEKNMNMKILFYGSKYSPGEMMHEEMVMYDGQTNSYNFVFRSKFYGSPLCFFQSLISI